MQLHRAVPVLTVRDVRQAVATFRDVLGLEVVMDLGWVATVGAVDGPQVTLMTEDATAPCPPDASLEVSDVDLAHARAVAEGLEIVHPPTDEPWGVRRFFFRDPAGNVINVLAHA
jgi:catechol 2,3-dioxygenase-like lactoylglutathione lyase family enzyme